MPPNRKRQLCVEDECPTDCAPSQANKRRKFEDQQPHRTPSWFWDNLSRLWLTSRALREFDRRTVRPTAPVPPDRTGKENIGLAQLKRFARHGGPSLSDLRAYPESESTVPSNRRMASTRSGSRKKARTGRKSDISLKTRNLSAYDPAFQQHLIDCGVYPNMYGDIKNLQKPHNLEEIKAKLALRRASLSPSRFTDEAFLDFQQKNETALTENTVMSKVIPIITGTSSIPSQENLLFGNLKDLTDGSITKAKPDCYDGSLPADLNRQIREDLGSYIVPSTNTAAPCLPNFFIEGKGPDGNLVVCQRQALYDGALGARGIAELRSYVDLETAYDNNAYVITSIYDPCSGVLKLYTTHCTRSTNPNRDYEYHMTQIRAWAMTGSLDAFRQGASALRHARDLAREKREELILAANSRVPDAEHSDLASSTPPFDSLLSHTPAHWETETSSDELAVDTNIIPTPDCRTRVTARPEPLSKVPLNRRSTKRVFEVDTDGHG